MTIHPPAAGASPRVSADQLVSFLNRSSRARYVSAISGRGHQVRTSTA